MKLAMVRPNPSESARPAVVISGERVLWLKDLLGMDAPISIDQMIQSDHESWLKALRSAYTSRTWQGTMSRDMVWESPIEFHRNPLCIGRNYRDHAQEAIRSGVAKHVNEEFPIFFTKATTTLNHHLGEVTAFDATQALDYEAELGVVIGRAGRRIDREDAETMIFGYTLVNDITARDVQQRHQQWFLGKSFDGFCPVGPVVVTRDEVPWPLNLAIRLAVNGEERQMFNTRAMIFDVADQIAWLSRAMTLLPGDLIATGTGDGVGRSFTPPRYLSPGDRVDIDCSVIGRLTTLVVDHEGQ